MMQEFMQKFGVSLNRELWLLGIVKSTPMRASCCALALATLAFSIGCDAGGGSGASMDKLKKIWQVGMLYESAHQCLPRDDRAKGDNVFSWRYGSNQYFRESPNRGRKLEENEPWDSEKNLELMVEYIPPTLKSPGCKDGHTVFKRAVGNGALFSEAAKVRQQLGSKSLTDGQQTIMLVEVDKSESVPWTKPGSDYLYDPVDPFRGLAVYGGKVNVVLLNGDALQVSTEHTELMRALFSKAGGENIDNLLKKVTHVH